MAHEKVEQIKTAQGKLDFLLNEHKHLRKEYDKLSA